jgi:hypothetical protein
MEAISLKVGSVGDEIELMAHERWELFQLDYLLRNPFS